MNKNEYPNVMTILGFELTRRCNMKCPFCTKGDSQNMDMPKEIIDKTLDLIVKENIFMYEIRLCGGEPFLCADGIEYLINEITRLNIHVDCISCFTNASIKDERILTAFKKFIEYRKSIDVKLEKIKDDIGIRGRHKYLKKETNGVSIFVSTYLHDLDEQSRDDMIEFYNSMDEKEFLHIFKEPTKPSTNFPYIISGLMKKNYKKLIGKSYNFVLRIPINEYDLSVKRYHEENFYIGKTICISANGNIFPGYSKSYECVDANPMFNVTEYDSLIHPIVQWAFEHPINEKFNHVREQYETLKWCDEHKISLNGLPESQKLVLEQLYQMSFAHEEIAKELHKTHSTLDLAELDMLTTMVIVMNLYGNGVQDIAIKNYLHSVSMIEDAPDIENINPEWVHGFTTFLVKKDLERKAKGIQKFI